MGARGLTVVDSILIPRLVPKPLWRQGLRYDLGSTRWGKLSKEIRLLANNTCEICGGQSETAPVKWKTCLDEVWAYDFEEQTAYLSDLRVICWWCNAITHVGFTTTTCKPPMLARVLEHGAKVNGFPSVEVMGKVCELHLNHHARISRRPNWTIDWDDWEAVADEARERLTGTLSS